MVIHVDKKVRVRDNHYIIPYCKIICTRINKMQAKFQDFLEENVNKYIQYCLSKEKI